MGDRSLNKSVVIMGFVSEKLAAGNKAKSASVARSTFFGGIRFDGIFPSLLSVLI